MLVTYGALCKVRPLPVSFGGCWETFLHGPQLCRDKSGTEKACRMPGVTSAQQLCPTLVAQCPGPDSPASCPSCAFPFSLLLFSPHAEEMPPFYYRISYLLPLVLTEKPWCSFCTQPAASSWWTQGWSGGGHPVHKAPRWHAFLSPRCACLLFLKCTLASLRWFTPN